MKSDRGFPVAIIGAGFSGTMTAAQLARRGIASVLVDPSEAPGLGAAYSTSDPAHLLNVPAGNMSAWPDAPGDFAARAGDPASFAQRRSYGGYLRSILQDAVDSGCVTVEHDKAVAAKRQDGRWAVVLQGGGQLLADALVLATGNQPPGRLRALEGSGDKLIANPWGSKARQVIEEAAAHDSDVLIVGTGLTMVDVVLSLDAAGHRGRILALSRRGLVPRQHAPHEPALASEAEIPSDHVRELLRWLRARALQHGWRAAVDSLRPHSQRLWQSFPRAEQERFLRHARPWWDVHRHRIAPQIAARLSDMISQGRLEVVAGRISASQAAGQGVDVEFRRRGKQEAVRRPFAFVFNCTGPLHSIERATDPLFKQMLGDGLVASDELGIGIAVDDKSRGQGAERLWVVGALTKARFWEIIAVPDIRGQAAAVAEDIEEELGG